MQLRYLTDREAAQTLRRIGALSAPQSAMFFDAISASYVRQRIVPGNIMAMGNVCKRKGGKPQKKKTVSCIGVYL